MVAFIVQCAAAVGASLLANLPALMVLAVAFTVLGLVSSACNPGPPWWRKPDLAVDLVYWMALPLVSSFARVSFLSAGAALLQRRPGGRAGRRVLGDGAGPLAASVLGPGRCLPDPGGPDDVRHDRAFHTASLWRYHAVHHAPEHLEWTSANRFHPVNVALHGVLADSVLLLAGIAPEVLVFLVPVGSACRRSSTPTSTGRSACSGMSWRARCSTAGITPTWRAAGR